MASRVASSAVSVQFGSGSGTLACPVSPTAGNSLIVVISGFKVSTGVVPTITVASGTATIGTPRTDVTKASALGTQLISAVVVVPITGSGSLTLQFTSTNDALTVGWDEITGLAATPTLDQTWTNSGTGTAYSTGAGSPTGAGIVVAGYAEDSVSSVTYSSYSDTSVWAQTNNANTTGTQQEKIVSGAGSVTLTVNTSASYAWQAVAASYLDAGGGAAPALQAPLLGSLSIGRKFGGGILRSRTGARIEIRNYTTPTQTTAAATVDIAGTCCASAVLRGAGLTQSLALSPCPVRSTARLTGTLTQTQPVTGTSRSSARLTGALGTAQAIAGTVRSGARLTGALGTKQAITGTVRSAARLTGATLLQSQPLTGSSRSLARLTGTMSAAGPGAVAIAGTTRSTARMLGVTLAQTIPLAGSSRSIARARGVLTQSQAIAGVVRSTARLTGRLTQSQRIAGTVRALPRLLGATLTAIIPGSVAIAGTVRALARLLGLPSITAPELVRIEVLEQVEAPAHVLAVEAPVWLAAVELSATVVPLTLPATLTVVDAPARIIPQT